MLISQVSYREIQNIQVVLAKKLDEVNTLEEASQQFVETIYHEFSESIILLRLFVTLPAGELPQEIYSFAENLAKGAKVPINQNSYILTLMGTVGIETTWNNYTSSIGHKGIPLATEDFVSSIPMMSALLEELGFDLGWIRGEPEIVAKKMGKIAGTFYVRDAKTAKDSKDRFIITARDFVEKYDVSTVFGLGGGYIVTDKFLTTICFLRETIDKETAILFQGLINVFKSKTQRFIADKTKYFK